MPLPHFVTALALCWSCARAYPPLFSPRLRTSFLILSQIGIRNLLSRRHPIIPSKTLWLAGVMSIGVLGCGMILMLFRAFPGVSLFGVPLDLLLGCTPTVVLKQFWRCTPSLGPAWG